MFHSTIVSFVITLACASGLCACASAPKYAAADGADAVGHYSTRLGENRYRIVYNGGRTAGPNTTRDYAMLRAAQLTLSEGYDWFEVVDRETTTTRESEPAGDFSVERAYYVERSCGLLGCSQSVSPATTTRVGAGTRDTRTEYSHMLEIVMGKGALPGDDGSYYDAGTVARSLAGSR